MPSGITFYRLHKIIQAAFGSQDYHLFDFDFGDVVVCLPDPDYAPGELYGGVRELNAGRTKIDALLIERKGCIYTYDLGDNWRHEVVLEKALPAGEGGRCPKLIAAPHRRRTPEECLKTVRPRSRSCSGINQRDLLCRYQRRYRQPPLLK
ncbi:MAG: plasmid pRiA4b ORF-3 family protein [Bacillota bacterium]